MAERVIHHLQVPFREGTNDAVIYDAVVKDNEYQLPGRLSENSVVLDIGAHVGTFSYLALTRGAGRVFAFEPEPSNCEIARRNLAQFNEKAVISRQAVWRSDVPVPALHFWPSADTANRGGGTVIWETSGPDVDAVAFDDVVDRATQHGTRRISLVKVDCEGAEFPILLTSKKLSWIDRIVGEYHELLAEPPPHARVPGVSQFSLSILTEGLERAGFRTTWRQQAMGPHGATGLFFADRPSSFRRLLSALRLR